MQANEPSPDDNTIFLPLAFFWNPQLIVLLRLGVVWVQCLELIPFVPSLKSMGITQIPIPLARSSPAVLNSEVQQ